MSRSDLKTGSTLFEHFRVEKLLGKGSYGVVYKCTDTRVPGPPRTVAIKLVLASSSTSNLKITADMIEEISTSKKLSPHPNIAAIDDVKYDHERKWLGIFMPFAPHGDLLNYVQEVHADESLNRESKGAILTSLAADVLCGLAHMHYNGILHLDLKPENCLVFDHPTDKSKVVAKLADFGFAVRYAHMASWRWPVGTPLYRPGEVVCDGESKDVIPYTEATDMWAYGVMVMDIFFNRGPFPDDVEPNELDTMRIFLTGARPDSFKNKSPYTAVCKQIWETKTGSILPPRTWQELSDRVGALVPDADWRKAGLELWGETMYKRVWTIAFACLKFNPKERSSASQLLGDPLFAGYKCTMPVHRNVELHNAKSPLYGQAAEQRDMLTKLAKDKLFIAVKNAAALDNVIEVATDIKVRIDVLAPRFLVEWKDYMRSTVKPEVLVGGVCLVIASKVLAANDVREQVMTGLNVLMSSKAPADIVDRLELEVLSLLGWNLDGAFLATQAVRNYCASHVPSIVQLPLTYIGIYAPSPKDRYDLLLAGEVVIKTDVDTYELEDTGVNWVSVGGLLKVLNKKFTAKELTDELCKQQREGAIKSSINITLRAEATDKMIKLFESTKTAATLTPSSAVSVGLFQIDDDVETPLSQALFNESTRWTMVLEPNKAAVSLSWDVKIGYAHLSAA